MRAVLRRPGAGELEQLGRFKLFLKVWGPAMIGVAVIVAESTPTFSASNTGSWLRPIAERLLGPIKDAAWAEAHHLLRKSGHFAGYGTLCVLFLRGWLLTFARKPELRTRVWRLRSWMCAVMSTFAVASGDELHQSFLPSRTGMFSDVVLDTLGGMMVSGIVLGMSQLMRRRVRRS